jgi:hypothetical protein
VSRYRAQVADAIAAAAVHPSGSCSWCGRRMGRPPPRTLPAEARHAYAVALLEQVLYQSFYCSGAAPRPAQDEPPAALEPEFVEALSAANSGQGFWDAGWRVDDRRDGDLVLAKDGLRLVARRSQVRLQGRAAQIRMPKELREASPGFYVAVSDVVFGSPSGGPMVRLYFHLLPESAAALVATVTSRLNGLRLPFRLKVVDAPERFTRCDAAVLYARAVDFDALRPMLRDLGVALRERTPAFTKPLAPGIGLAEQPATEESFGSHRCRLLAEGILEAHRLGLRRPGERLAAVEAHFAARRVDLDAPYLEPGSRDRYTL